LASELVFAAIRGTRFWSYEKAEPLWRTYLLPMLELMMEKVTPETILDWETCVNGATNKVDPNRVRWLFEWLLDKRTVLAAGGGSAFKESCFLRFLGKAIAQDYKIREVYVRAFPFVVENMDHPFDKVRAEVSRALAALTAFDIRHGEEKANMGEGFPTVAELLKVVTPHLTLAMRNPEVVNGLMGPPPGSDGSALTLVVRPDDGDDSRRHQVVDDEVADEDIDEDDIEGEEDVVGEEEVEEQMEVDEDGEDDEHASLSDAGPLEEKDSKEARTLQTMAQFVYQHVHSNFTTVRLEFFELLPYFCQFNGSERSMQEVT